jgi:hypothetical protein
MDNLKKQEEARMAKQQKELRKQENEVKEIIKKKARFDITKKNTIKESMADGVEGANFDGML